MFPHRRPCPAIRIRPRPAHAGGPGENPRRRSTSRFFPPRRRGRKRPDSTVRARRCRRRWARRASGPPGALHERRRVLRARASAGKRRAHRFAPRLQHLVSDARAENVFHIDFSRVCAGGKGILQHRAGDVAPVLRRERAQQRQRQRPVGFLLRRIETVQLRRIFAGCAADSLQLRAEQGVFRPPIAVQPRLPRRRAAVERFTVLFLLLPCQGRSVDRGGQGSQAIGVPRPAGFFRPVQRQRHAQRFVLQQHVRFGVQISRIRFQMITPAAQTRGIFAASVRPVLAEEPRRRHGRSRGRSGC